MRTHENVVYLVLSDFPAPFFPVHIILLCTTSFSAFIKQDPLTLLAEESENQLLLHPELVAV